jgi:hypothetical protein
VLPASNEEVPERLAEMSVLLKDVQQAVEDSGSAGHTAQVRHYRDEWEVAIFPRDRALTLAVQEFWPSELGLVALQSAAELDKLRSQVEELIEETKAATDLDDDVKRLIVARLRDIIRALDHVNVGGLRRSSSPPSPSLARSTWPGGRRRPYSRPRSCTKSP